MFDIYLKQLLKIFGIMTLQLIYWVSGSAETVLRAMIPLYMTLSMSQFLTPMLMVVVDEKEKRIKESMKMVGLRDSVFWYL